MSEEEKEEKSEEEIQEKVKEYRSRFKKRNIAPGWDAIDRRLDLLFKKAEPMHVAPELPAYAGGEDFLDGISIYTNEKQEEHFHFVSYGLSELYYNEEAVAGEYSKWGFELTFRLKPWPEDEGQPDWVIDLMQNLARYVFDSGKWFEQFHFIPINGPIRAETDTEITAIGFAMDRQLKKINTYHGEVLFLQMVGLTRAEAHAISEGETTCRHVIKQLEKDNKFLITDLNRRESVNWK